jgi:outer membrane immunogenic protein
MRTLVRVLATLCLTGLMLLAPFLVQAADPNTWPNLPPNDRYAEPEGRVWHRTGPYVGIVGGANIAQFEVAGFDFDDKAWIGGAMAGFNVRTQGLVLGLEGDFLLTDIKADLAAGTVVASTKYLATVRGRVGVPIGPALLYATAGVAFTEDKIVAGSTTNEFKVGWAAGAGIEAELSRSLFVRLEALHYAFPERDVSAFEAKDQQTTARVAIGFKLN